MSVWFGREWSGYLVCVVCSTPAARAHQFATHERSTEHLHAAPKLPAMYYIGPKLAGTGAACAGHTLHGCWHASKPLAGNSLFVLSFPQVHHHLTPRPVSGSWRMFPKLGTRIDMGPAYMPAKSGAKRRPRRYHAWSERASRRVCYTRVNLNLTPSA